MDEAAEVLQAARDAYRRRDWPGARQRFAAARAAGELAADDLEAFSDAAWWLGEVDQSLAVLEEACRRHLDDGRPRAAAMAAIGVALHHFLRGDGVVGFGWMGRAQRLLHDQPENVEHGYARYFDLEAGLVGADPAAVIANARWVKEIGRRHGDPTWSPSGACSRAGCCSSRAGWPRGWPCWTRRCWRCCRRSCARSGPATSTAT